MRAVSPPADMEEIELKLGLPGADPSTLLALLKRVPVLARRKRTTLHLHNVYFDAPALALRRQRIALRLRRVGNAARPQWLQTRKTAGRADSALSQRGEWEAPVREARLSLKALKKTPWPGIDADGNIFRALVPVFETNFERTVWLIRQRDGSVVEVALDIGHILAGERSTPLCEIELELKAGKPTALFDIAKEIAGHIAVLPAAISKAERGYALTQETAGSALRAAPPSLPTRLPVTSAAQRVLCEMFSQFTSNLGTVLISDDPEVVHQARVGWRRFKSARRLFAPVLALEAVPSWQPLQTVLICLGRLRDLEVAGRETLPALADAYIADDPRRADIWQHMTQSLAQATQLQRKTVRYALQDPTVGACLLATTQWLEGLSLPDQDADASGQPGPSLRRWSRDRIGRLRGQLKLARKSTETLAQRHRVRILAKRMRYNVEALFSLLPLRRAQRWREQAIELQTRLGVSRDAMQAATLVAELGLDRGLAEFLRGLAVGQGA
jgi:inorganic triphosphatase YgiF